MPPGSSNDDLLLALDTLRASKVKRVWATFEEVYRATTGSETWFRCSSYDTDLGTGGDIGPAAWDVMSACQRAVPALLEASNACLLDHEDSDITIVADLANDMVTYEASAPQFDHATLHSERHSWPLRGSELFKQIGYVSALYGSEQWRVFDAWRPNGADVMGFEWKEREPMHLRSDMHAPIWPDDTRPEVAALKNNLNGSLPAPTKSHPRSQLSEVLTVDFLEEIITLDRSEELERINQIAAGVFPLDELMWLAAEPADTSGRADAMEEFQKTGGVKRVVAGEDVVLNSGAPIPAPKIPFSERWSDFDEWEGSDFTADAAEADERRLLNEELSGSQDAHARSEEDGWFYDDD